MVVTSRPTSSRAVASDRNGNFFAITVLSGRSFCPVNGILFFPLMLMLGVVAAALAPQRVIPLVTFLPELLSKLGDIHQILFGLALVAVVVLLPDGLMGAFGRLRTRLAARQGNHARYMQNAENHAAENMQG